MTDYSQTIYRFTLFAAYPVIKIDKLVNKIAQQQVYSTIDLRIASQQVIINSSDKLHVYFFLFLFFLTLFLFIYF